MGSFDDSVVALYAVAYRVGYRMLGSRHDAEEVAQEVCARALDRWSKIEAYAEPWAARSASNLVLDRLRRTRRWIPRAPSVQPPPDGERVDLVRALRSLPRRQRDVIVLRYLGDFSEEEVASKLGCSLGTVKQHAHRAMLALRATEASPATEGR